MNLPRKKLKSHFLYYLAIFIIFSLSLGQFARFDFSFLPPFYLHDISIFIFNLFTLDNLYNNLKKFLPNRKLIFTYRSEFFFLLFLIIRLVISSITNFHFRTYLYIFRFINYLLFSLSLNKYFPHKKTFFLISSSIILILGFFQYLFLPDLRILSYLGWDDHYYRLTSTILDPNFTGLIFAITIIYLFRFKKTFLIKILITFFSLGLLLTYSRSSYLCFLSSLIILFLYNFYKEFLQQKNILSIAKKNLFLLFIIISIPIAIFFLPDSSGGEGVKLTRTSTIQARIQSHRYIINSLSPLEIIFGRGVLTKKITNNRDLSKYSFFSYHSYLPDNCISLIINFAGITGLFFFFILIYKHLLPLYHINIHAFIIIVSVIIHSFFNASLTHPFIILFTLNLLDL